MGDDKFFIQQKPSDPFLSTLVDSYFYIDADVNELDLSQESIIPFPRITFGYFFNHPFLVTNHTVGESVSVNMAISRISTDQITVQPETTRVKIIGAHVRPFCLAYLTPQPVKAMPWLINTIELFKERTQEFKLRIDACVNVEQMFKEVEKMFLDNILVRDLTLITHAIQIVDEKAGNIKLLDLAKQLGVSERTIRTHFYNHIGCSPKEYLRLVKLKHVAFQVKHSNDSLTAIAYDNKYFDQAHFIHDVKDITGKSPNELKKEVHTFRFLQF